MTTATTLVRHVALIATTALAGCGGGGSAPPALPANTAPTFTSAASVTVLENTAGAVYTAAASDAQNGPLTFAIAGGADAAQFTLSSGGQLAFRTPPDFEAPADSDRDNVYRLQLSVSDGRAQTTLDVAVTVTDAGGGTFRVRRAGTGFVQPLYLAGIPDNSGRVLVVEQAGRIRILDPATGAIAATPFLDIRGTISSDGERGLIGLALAPDFASSGTFFVYLTNLAGDTEVRRYRTFAANRDQADPATADLILTFAQPFANHNGGWIEFGPDGFLYIASGDGGSGGDPQNNAQNTASLLGKMLRIDVASDAFPADPARDYAIPASNPFATSGGAPEVYAFGLRNPFRNSFDPATGNLYLGDVGQAAIEEIDLIPPNRPGLDFGWARLEGTRTFNGTPPPNAVPPVAEYAHGTGPVQGDSVTGGYVYRGPVESLQGQYIFGDFVRGRLWSIPATSLVFGQTFAASSFTLRNADFTPDAGAIGNIASFGQDQRRNLYIVDYDGEIFVIEGA
ncbi:sorbosone dehydrogenase family protein [Novosphingobium sp. Gsoil 351]|uniref:PQQ-dependent sugar dehydrogenase n=1 Tax=Novosphingobium sp. Gsoil 351 TaxID=2675225 RepID=UPI0018A863FE|nr:PQQ-dependent sugar dehydrogenase [Novosphingobium sp. Gsoil 351]